MLKKLFFLNIALLCCQLVTVQAQSISPKVISSAGSTATGGSSIINYNVGEPVIGTLTGGSYQITQGFEQPGGVNSTLLTGIISYWKLDETSGTTAIDAAGGGNNGTDTNDTLGVPGKIHTAYGFNGVTANSKIDMANTSSTSSNLNLTTSGSISAWVSVPVIHPHDINSYYYAQIVSRENGGTAKGYTLYFAQYENEFTGEFSAVVGGKDTVDRFYFSGVPLTTSSDNVWIHLVVTWDGSHIVTYMNGANAHSVAQTVTPGSNANPFSIGYNAVGSPNYWRGRIDEVGIWNRALTAGEDSLLYAAGYG